MEHYICGAIGGECTYCSPCCSNRIRKDGNSMFDIFGRPMPQERFGDAPAFVGIRLTPKEESQTKKKDTIYRQDAIDAYTILADKMDEYGKEIVSQMIEILKMLRSAV